MGLSAAPTPSLDCAIARVHSSRRARMVEPAAEFPGQVAGPVELLVGGHPVINSAVQGAR